MVDRWQLATELTGRMRTFTEQTATMVKEDPELLEPALKLFLCMVIATEALSGDDKPLPFLLQGRVMILGSFLNEVGTQPQDFASLIHLGLQLLDAPTGAWVLWLLAAPIVKFTPLYIQAAKYASLVMAHLPEEDPNEG